MSSRIRSVGLHLGAVIAVVGAAACASHTASRDRGSATAVGTVVTLDRIDDPGVVRGLHNIFFDTVPTRLQGSLRLGDGWSRVQVANVIAEDGMQPVRVVRFTSAVSTDTTYVIDTGGAGNFARAPVLTFERRQRARVANVELTVRSRSGNMRRVPYQVLVADDGYTYARIAEYRVGRWRLDGHDYAVRIQNESHGHPFYALNEGTAFVIDLNGDGQFAEQATVAVGGRAVAAEHVLASMPFAIGSHVFELAAIDSAGTWLRIRPSNRAVAVAEGRRAPDVATRTLTGGAFRLSKQTGKVVLLEFWATDCHYSEQVRSAANELVSKYGAKYVWVAIPKDTSRVELEQHLTKFPMRGTVTMRDSAAWATYNLREATPVFVVVDQRGIVRFRAEGASAIEAVTAKLDELLAARP